MRPRLSIVTSLGINSQDLKYAKLIAKKYSQNHAECVVEFKDIVEIVPEIIKTFKTFDPLEIRNSSVIYVGIREAKYRGYDGIVTGDGADELFAGYNYLQRYFTNLRKLQEVLIELWKIMRFSSLKIGETLGLKVNTPYLEKPLYELATSIDISEKVGEYRSKKCGKFILRKAFAKELGSTVWRKKMALEEGSGFDQISNKFNDLIYDEEFEKESKIVSLDKVIVKDKEHLYYYRLYKSLFGIPAKEPCQSLRCSYCRSCLPFPKYCYTCGAFPPI
jgi:asparagine synthase (glutamine-hydrolysing)